ncbi:MAG: GNAT family N-acetyltransferase [Pyrinomonadaceae bacterium]
MNENKTEIRHAKRQDIPAIIELMREFAEFESLLGFLEVTEKSLADVIFGEDRFVNCLLVTDDDVPVAYALYYRSFSSFRGHRSVYLEDIFITASHRSRGVGELLLKAVARAGKDFGAVRMDFQVLDWNKPAVDFYKKHGAVIDKDERHFKFTDEAFEKLSGNSG